MKKVVIIHLDFQKKKPGPMVDSNHSHSKAASQPCGNEGEYMDV